MPPPNETNQTFPYRFIGRLCAPCHGTNFQRFCVVKIRTRTARMVPPNQRNHPWKMEYQTNEKEGRFEVRTARIAFDGRIVPMVEYKAEIDLSDEGKIKMLDAYAGVLPLKGMNLRLGQMRVPFSIDAHRSPHKQYFANRSFIAKQVGNVRDVGFYAAYHCQRIPLSIEAGVFNGSGLTNQKDYWTKEFNYSAKLQYKLPLGFTLQASVQKLNPSGISTYLYDGGITFQHGRFTAECEYLRKHYNHGAFSDVNALDAFVSYDQPLRRVFQKVSFLCRYDRMDNHSDGTLNDEGTAMKLTDAARQRVTGGITLSLPKDECRHSLELRKVFLRQHRIGQTLGTRQSRYRTGHPLPQ